VNVGKSMDFVNSCYLIKHTQGWLLWDTGLADAIAAMPEGQRPSDPRAIHWRRPKTLAAQIEQLGVKPSDIKYVSVSHSHPDHIGNVSMFPQSMLLVQKADYDWPAKVGPRFKPELPVTKLEGDHDVFGDGSVTIIATPGHTPGHQSLLVKLRRPARCCLPATPSISRRTGTTAAFRSSIATKSRAALRCSALPTSWPRKTPSSGLITTRCSGMGKSCHPISTSEVRKTGRVFFR
jgi:hypothetical protein